jgi:hypothetical protein
LDSRQFAEILLQTFKSKDLFAIFSALLATRTDQGAAYPGSPALEISDRKPVSGLRFSLLTKRVWRLRDNRAATDASPAPPSGNESVLRLTNMVFIFQGE